MAKKSIRVARPARTTGIPNWLKFVAGLILTLVGVHWLLISQIEHFGDGIVNSLGMVSAASHRGGYYTWDGDLGIRNLRVESLGGDGAYLQIDKLELDGPGWWWTIQLGMPWSRSDRITRTINGALGRGSKRENALPNTSSLYLRMKGLDLDLGRLLPPGTPEPGFASGVPFETAGCTGVRYFLPLNLREDLRLRHQGANLSFGYRADGPTRVRTEIEYDVPAVMRASFEVDLQVENSRRFLETSPEEYKVLAQRVVLHDLGFNEARNRWCAEQAGIDEEEFQRRHITTVRRMLEVYGVQMTPETEAIYSSFAASGGRLQFDWELDPSVTPTLMAQYTPDQRWGVLNVRIGHNNDPMQPMGLEFVRARPLPSAYSGSVYDLMTRNADAPDKGSAQVVDAIGARMRGLAASPDVPSPPTPIAAPGTTASSSPTPRQSRAPTPVALDSASLEAAIGQTVEVTTADGSRRIGELRSVDPLELVLRVRFTGGTADLTFTRDRVTAVVRNPRSR